MALLPSAHHPVTAPGPPGHSRLWPRCSCLLSRPLPSLQPPRHLHVLPSSAQLVGTGTGTHSPPNELLLQEPKAAHLHTCVLSPTRTRQMLRQPSRISTGRTRATAAPTCPHLPPEGPSHRGWEGRDTAGQVWTGHSSEARKTGAPYRPALTSKAAPCGSPCGGRWGPLRTLPPSILTLTGMRRGWGEGTGV